MISFILYYIYDIFKNMSRYILFNGMIFELLQITSLLLKNFAELIPNLTGSTFLLRVLLLHQCPIVKLVEHPGFAPGSRSFNDMLIYAVMILNSYICSKYGLISQSPSVLVTKKCLVPNVTIHLLFN